MGKFENYMKDIKIEEIKEAWEKILTSLFQTPTGYMDWTKDPNLKDTPFRIASSIVNERCIGIDSERECEDLLNEQFPTTYDGMITIGPLEVYSLCPHHFESISYLVYFGYIPRYTNGKVVGLSKPGRVIKLLASQPILQEEYTKKLADIFMRKLNPEGIGLIVKGKHMCMSARGLEQPKTYTTTSEMRGWFRDHKTVKDEFMEFCREN